MRSQFYNELILHWSVKRLNFNERIVLPEGSMCIGDCECMSACLCVRRLYGMVFVRMSTYSDDRSHSRRANVCIYSEPQSHVLKVQAKNEMKLGEREKHEKRHGRIDNNINRRMLNKIIHRDGVFFCSFCYSNVKHEHGNQQSNTKHSVITPYSRHFDGCERVCVCEYMSLSCCGCGCRCSVL